VFHDRVDAARQLAEKLARFHGAPDAVVLGIPRGGVVVAAEVARILGLPLDIVVVRKIGAPGNPEYAVGAIDEDGRVLRNLGASVSADYLEREAPLVRAEVERRLAAYRGGRAAVPLEGRTAILVDDGIATGLTARAAVEFVRSRGAASVVLAVPVIAQASAEELRRDVDELVAVGTPAVFYAVGEFYDVFGQTTDAEVERLLNAPGSGGSPGALGT